MELRRSLRQACERGDFRVVHYSVQRNHVHLRVESAGRQALGRGMKAVSARLARAVNRVFRRSGPVLYGRYHSPGLQRGLRAEAMKVAGRSRLEERPSYSS